MIDTYLVHRYLLISNTVFCFWFVFILLGRLSNQGLSKYTSREYLEKLNIRSLAIWSLLASCVVSGLATLFVAYPKYAHGYYLNIFSQRVIPAHSLFYSQGNYILYHFGLSLGLLGKCLRSCFLCLTVCLFLPSAVYLLKDRTKICSVLSWEKYCGILYYAFAKPAISAAVLLSVGSGIGDASSDYDVILLLDSILSCGELIFLGFVTRSVAENLFELAASETFSSQQPSANENAFNNSTSQSAASYLSYADRLLLDSGIDSNPNALYSVVAKQARLFSNALLAEGIITCILIIFYAFLSGGNSAIARDSYDWLRDFLVALLFFAAGFATWFGIGILMPLKRFHLSIKPADHPRLTHLESFFWRPSIFLMDPLSRNPIREDHERRIAQAANLARVPRPPPPTSTNQSASTSTNLE